MSKNIKLREDIGVNIKELRRLKRLTQQQLAQKMNCDQSVISHLERGSRRTSFDIETLELCAINLGCKLHDLIPDS